MRNRRPSRCTTCGRDPQHMNSPVAECSHPDCQHRRRAPELDHHEHIGDAAYRARPTNEE